MSVLHDYKVIFFKRGTTKYLSTVNEALTSYIGVYGLDVAKMVLNDIEDVMAGKATIELDKLAISKAVVSSSTTKIYDDMEAHAYNNAIAPDFILPTTDFKIIFEAWINYLQ